MQNLLLNQGLTKKIDRLEHKQIIATPEQNTFGIIHLNTLSQKFTKSVAILPVLPNDWLSITKEDVKGAFVFTLRTHNLDEGTAIFKSLAPYLGAESELEEQGCPDSDFKSFKIDGVYSAHIWNSSLDKPLNFARCLPSVEGRYELVIEFNLSHAGKVAAASFYQSINKEDKFEQTCHTSLSQQNYDLSSNAARRDWGYFTYYDWAMKLSFEEKRSLQAFGGPDYRDIQRYMRGQDLTHVNSRVSEWAFNIGNAIEKGVTDREVIVYRAARQPLINNWDILSSGKHSELSHIDAGFFIGTLDRDAAKFWNKVYLGGQGIITELTVPKGTASAFLDAEGIITDRGYLEIVLASNQRMTLSNPYVDESGQKYLKGEIGKNH